VSCLVAGAAFYYEYTTSFTEAIKVTTMCLFVYWTLQAISFGYYFFVEQNEIFAGSQKLDGKVRHGKHYCT
jgi:signal peptidase complex subunit 2